MKRVDGPVALLGSATFIVDHPLSERRPQYILFYMDVNIIIFMISMN